MSCQWIYAYLYQCGCGYCCSNNIASRTGQSHSEYYCCDHAHDGSQKEVTSCPFDDIYSDRLSNTCHSYRCNNKPDYSADNSNGRSIYCSFGQCKNYVFQRKPGSLSQERDYKYGNDTDESSKKGAITNYEEKNDYDQR